MPGETKQRRVTVTVQAIAEKQGARGVYSELTSPPRPGMQYPDTWKVFDLDLVKGVKVGDTVTLVLEQGSPKKDGKGYWENVVGIEHPALQREGPGKEAAVQGVAKPEPERVEPEKFPWHRYIAWGELVEQALKMVAVTAPLGETEEGKPPEAQLETYAQRFNWAMETICQTIRQQMKGVPADPFPPDITFKKEPPDITLEKEIVVSPKAEATPKVFKTFGEVADWAFKTFNLSPADVFKAFAITGWTSFASPQRAAELIEAKYGRKEA